MIVCHNRKYIFVHVYKAGGTSVEMALAPTLDWRDLILGSTELGEAMNEPFRARYGLGIHSTVDEIVDVCGAEILDEYYSFAFVRHPVARAVSSFNFVHSLCVFHCRRCGTSMEELRRLIIDTPVDDKARNQAETERPFLKWGITRGFLAGRTFGDFIRDPLVQGDPFFFPQIETIRSRDCAMQVADVFKLEEIARHLPAISRRLKVPIPLMHENRSPFPVLATAEVAADDSDFLRQFYDQDFIAFEYS